MRVATALTLAAMLATGACSKPPELTVRDAWIRLPAVKGQPGAAYFTVEGGAAEDRLILVTADYAIRSEMHETTKSGGMMSMKPVAAGFAIPAATKVEFKPGGPHVMLFDVRPGLKPGDAIPLNLRFASGVTFTVNATARAAGE